MNSKALLILMGILPLVGVSNGLASESADKTESSLQYTCGATAWRHYIDNKKAAETYMSTAGMFVPGGTTLVEEARPKSAQNDWRGADLKMSLSENKNEAEYGVQRGAVMLPFNDNYAVFLNAATIKGGAIVYVNAILGSFKRSDDNQSYRLDRILGKVDVDVNLSRDRFSLEMSNIDFENALLRDRMSESSGDLTPEMFKKLVDGGLPDGSIYSLIVSCKKAH